MCMNLIGSGVVFHAPSFFKELAELEAKGLEGAHQRILVSDRCQINFELHAAVDGLEEVELGAEAIGTTKRGIGPSYSTKAARSGIRLAEAFDEELFEKKLRRLADGYKKRYGDLLKYDVEKEIADRKVRAHSLIVPGRWHPGADRSQEFRQKLAEYCVDAVQFISDAQRSNKKILIEGANALMASLPRLLNPPPPLPFSGWRMDTFF